MKHLLILCCAAFYACTGAATRKSCGGSKNLSTRLHCLKKLKSQDMSKCTKKDHEDRDTYFYLYTPNNPDQPEFLHLCDESLPKNSNFNGSAETEIFIHGYFAGICDDATMREMKDQLLQRGSYNVILVDWTWGSNTAFASAIENMAKVASHIVSVINDIKSLMSVDEKNFHLIGHGLGAHIAGQVGQKTVVRRITGLDPTYLKNATYEEELDITDAKLIDIIHTSTAQSDSCSPYLGGGWGGHAVFYVNGAEQQLSCIPKAIEAFAAGNIKYALGSLIPEICYHLQALQYYKVSINPGKCHFVGIQCEGYETFKEGRCNSCFEPNSDRLLCAVMGMEWEEQYKEKYGYGRFYVETTLQCPYCDNSYVKSGYSED